MKKKKTEFCHDRDHDYRFACAEKYDDGEFRGDIYFVCRKCGKVVRKDIFDLDGQE